MIHTISASFAARSDADMVVEQLVQKLGLAQDAIKISVKSAANSSGAVPSGADVDLQKTEKAQLAGRLLVAAQVDSSMSGSVRAVFREYHGVFE